MSTEPANLTAEELASFDLVRTADEWEATCRRVKASRNNRYPSDWYSKVIASGLIARIAARWGAKAEFEVRTVNEAGEVETVDTLPICPEN